jgi:hypothetical protein
VKEVIRLNKASILIALLLLSASATALTIAPTISLSVPNGLSLETTSLPNPNDVQPDNGDPIGGGGGMPG